MVYKQLLNNALFQKIANILLTAVETKELLDFHKVLIQLKTVHNKWRQIGKALHVPETHIEQIEPYCVDNDALGMSGMIGYWIKNCSGQPRWRELSLALATVGEKQLADKLMDASEEGITIECMVKKCMYNICCNLHFRLLSC